MAVLVATALVVAMTSTGQAADPQHGRALAKQWCESCHFAEGNRRAPDVGPPFGQIANDPAYTEARLRAWLHDPHPPMPKFELGRDMIADLIAYIRSLKD